MSYVVRRMDLSVAGLGQLVIGPNAGYTGWTVLDMPAALVSLRMGQSGDPIPVQVGMQWAYDPCDGPVVDGLYLDVPAAAGGFLTIIVFYGGGGLVS